MGPPAQPRCPAVRTVHVLKLAKPGAGRYADGQPVYEVKEDPVNGNPIAVFDSGLGGLSVVRELRRLLPCEDLVYFGDTARVPYGIKSRRTVVQFALEDARFLLRFKPKLVVAACNTASALALDELEAELPVPSIGVVRPGAEAAARLAEGAPVAVIGTEATIASEAYAEALRVCAPHLRVYSQACPLFVPLVEEGRACDDPIVRLTVQTYLSPLRELGVRVIVLGCTHYPLLREAIAECLGSTVHIVESGREVARAVREVLRASDGLYTRQRAGNLRCFVSDNPARFRRIGSRFLNHEIKHVELVEPEQYIASAVVGVECAQTAGPRGTGFRSLSRGTGSSERVQRAEA
jgi:glutamate racemase